MIRFRLAHQTVAIDTTVPEIHDDLSRLTASLAAEGAAAADDLVYHVDADGGAYTLRCAESSWPGLSRGEVFAQVETHLSRRLMQTEARAMLHAAALAREDQVYLFAGCSGCGKTTLATALLKRGFLFLSDEYAPISLEDLRLHRGAPEGREQAQMTIEPCSMPLKLRESTVRRISPAPEIELVEHGFFARGEPVYYGVVDPRFLAPARRWRCGRIYFPWKRPGLKTEAHRLRPSVAVQQLIGLTLNSPLLGAQAFNLAASLVETVPCFDLVVGDIDEACRVICDG
jgi:hypothetical protein